jgi:diguanylate cyclase (GGDEF)-like protein
VSTLRLASVLARASQPAEIAARVAEALVAVEDIAFATAYLLGEDGSLPPDRPDIATTALQTDAIAYGPGELALPLVAGEDRFGVLLVGVAADAAPRLERLLVTVADLTATAMSSLRRLDLALSEARHDALTGAGNFRAFQEQLERLLGADRSDPGPVGLALFDLDGLKDINDRLGHDAGDEALRGFARRAYATLRGGEEVYRVGGDEFAIVFDGDAAAAQIVADRVRVAVAAQRRGQVVPTVSAGIAAAPEHATTPTELIARADEALYAAKRAGKNQTVASANRT